MTLKDVIESSISSFHLRDWNEKVHSDFAKSPIGYYSYTYVFQQSNPIQLFNHPINRLFAYVENEKLIAFYMTIEFDEKVIHQISTELGAKPSELAEAYGDSDQDFIPFKWYWQHEAFSIGLHKMSATSISESGFDRHFGVIIISKYSLEDYTLKK